MAADVLGLSCGGNMNPSVQKPPCVGPSQEKNVPMIGVETRAQWLASVEVVSGYFESVASCWGKCIRGEDGKVIFWDGLTQRHPVPTASGLSWGQPEPAALYVCDLGGQPGVRSQGNFR